MGSSEKDLSGTFPEIPDNLDPICYKFLRGDPEGKETTTLERAWIPGAGVFIGGFGSLVANLASKLPLKAGIHKHIGFALIGGIICEAGWRYKQVWDSEKDAQFFHYMMLHPEDFKAPERKKFRDVIRPWVPFR